MTWRTRAARPRRTGCRSTPTSTCSRRPAGCPTCTTSASTGSTSRRCSPPSRGAPTATTWSRSTAWTGREAARRGWPRCPPRRGGWAWACWSTSCRTTSGVATPAANPWWWDVLEHGRGSVHAEAFDIDWEFGHGRCGCPVLGDDDLPVDGGRPATRGRRRRAEVPRPPFPDRARHDDGTPDEVHARQHYELVSWRRGDSRAELPAVLHRHHAWPASRRGAGGVRRHATSRCAAGSTRGSSTACASTTPTACATRRSYLDHLAEPHRRRLHAGREDPGAGRGARRAAGRWTAPPGTTRSRCSTACSPTRPASGR